MHSVFFLLSLFDYYLDFPWQGAASEVRVNSIAAGHVFTPIYGDTPRETVAGLAKGVQLIGRLIEPEEVLRNVLNTTALARTHIDYHMFRAVGSRL